MERFILQPSTSPGKWVVTDLYNGVVIVFEEKRFNDTPKVTLLEDTPNPNPLSLARIMREIGEWLYNEHKEIV